MINLNDKESFGNVYFNGKEMEKVYFNGELIFIGLSGESFLGSFTVLPRNAKTFEVIQKGDVE